MQLELWIKRKLILAAFIRNISNLDMIEYACFVCDTFYGKWASVFAVKFICMLSGLHGLSCNNCH